LSITLWLEYGRCANPPPGMPVTLFMSVARLTTNFTSRVTAWRGLRRKASRPNGFVTGHGEQPAIRVREFALRRGTLRASSTGDGGEAVNRQVRVRQVPAAGAVRSGGQKKAGSARRDEPC